MSAIDALSRDDARRLSLQWEVDPIDEEAQTATRRRRPPLAAAGRKKARCSRDPLVDTTPFGSEPAAASAEASANADDGDDAVLFGALWLLGDVVKLDATVDRRVLRQQRDRLGDLRMSSFRCPRTGTSPGSLIRTAVPSPRFRAPPAGVPSPAGPALSHRSHLHTGWTFVRLTRDQLIRELTAKEETEWSRKVNNNTLVCNVLWTVVRVTAMQSASRVPHPESRPP